ncbi:MAG TPA: insulinase family protein [Gemmatimonadaceae bacterium]
MTRFRTALLALLAFAGLAPAQAPVSSDPLPVDPKVITGVLPNGIHYYIRKNTRPEKRAELRLVVNAGSILEDDDQRGLAHFVEHTAFNGTTHFKKNDLISYLQSIGVRFGADLNASTNFDETVYILPIPTDTAKLVDKAFEILEDFAHGQTFDSTEVVNERGVVLEEWRGGRGAGERMLQQWLPIAFKGSRYAVRLPIGTDTSIKSAVPSKLRRFYNDWYRPDLEAVIAVGDFDPAVIKSEIESHFSGMKMPANPRPRTNATIPDNVEPLVAVATDKEAQGSDVDLIFKVPRQEVKTIADYRKQLMQDLALAMLNGRFEEIAQKPNAPFLGAGASVQSIFSRTTNAFVLGAGVKDGGIERGAEALLTEARRVDQFGFLSTELQRAKDDLLRGYERAFTERDKTESGSLVGEYVRNYLTGEAIPGIEYEYPLVQMLLPSITLTDVNTLTQGWITDKNRVIIAEAPDKAGVPVPTRAQLLATFDRAAKAPVTAYTETLSSEAIVDPLPTAGKIVAEKHRDDIDVTEWTLSNGIHVLVKPTDFKADQVLINGVAAGGTSLANDPDYMSASLSSQIVFQSGAGKFNATDLQKKLSGKAAGATITFDDIDETISGGGSPKDLETAFQLIYLRATAPRLDMDAWGAMKAQVEPYLQNKGNDPESVYGDTVTVTMAQHHFRARPLTEATFAEVDPNKALQFYKDRVANLAGFTFAIVGAVKLDELRPLVERYLASLPAGKPEMFRDVGPKQPAGVTERTVKKGTEPKANTRWLFYGPAVYAPENRFTIRALNELMQLRLDQILREQLGGTYSPFIGGGINRLPRPEYEETIEYGSSPENVEKLGKTVLQMIDSLQKFGPTQAEVDKVREQIIRARQVETKTNDYWAGNIVARYRAGEDIGGLGAPYDQFLTKLTAAQIQEAAKKYLDTSRYAKFILLPEKP